MLHLNKKKRKNMPDKTTEAVSPSEQSLVVPKTTPQPFMPAIRGRPTNHERSLYHDDTEYFDKVEKDATDANQTNDLHHEIKLLRASTLELLKKFRTGTAIKGYQRGTGDPIYVSDIEMTKAVCQLTKTISVLTKDDHDMTKENFISRSNFRIWLSNLAREIKLTFPKDVDQKKFSRIARKVGEPAGEG